MCRSCQRRWGVRHQHVVNDVVRHEAHVVIDVGRKETIGGHVVDDVVRCAHDIGNDMKSGLHVVNDVVRHEAYVESDGEDRKQLAAMSLTMSSDVLTISATI